MRAASRETYAAADEKLNELARDADPDTLLTVGDELLSVARLLAREPGLRRALADPARAGEERAELLDSLVGNVVSADSRELLKIVSTGRWSSASEMLDGVEQLGVDALLASAERAGDLSEVEDELFRFGQVVDGSPELAAVLGDITVEPSRRDTLVDSLLEGKAKPTTIRLAHLAVAGFGGRTLIGSLTRLVELAAERRQMRVAYVTVARALSDAEEQEFGRRLARMYGREMSVKVSVDPSIIGGARVLVGSDLYDGTISRRLAVARQALTSG